MQERNMIGHNVRILSNLIKRNLDHCPAFRDSQELTGMQGWIIGYLYDNQSKDIFQRDLEAKFTIRRSTVTGIIQLMEKNGLITREAVDSDARLKKIVLTKKAVDLHVEVAAGMKELESRLRADISEEDMETFFQVTQKMIDNIG